MSEIDEIVREKIAQIWEFEILAKFPLAKPARNPIGVVLGGQPGASKATLIKKAAERLNGDIIAINGDAFRRYHPHYAKFQREDARNSAAMTAEFAGKMVEMVLAKSIENRYNVVIEGTFRTAATPLKTLTKFKENGYETAVLLQICDRKLSWNSCVERFEKAQKIDPKAARATRKQDHDIVIQNLALNALAVYESGLADKFCVFGRFFDGENMQIRELFESQKSQNLSARMIQNILDGNS